MRFIIIGIDDNRKQEFKKEILDKLSNNRIFSGGKRHYEIVKSYLPIDHMWINITVPLKEVFEKYKSFY